MPKRSLAKLERHLYSAADRLRQEGLDAATYNKDYSGRVRVPEGIAVMG